MFNHRRYDFIIWVLRYLSRKLLLFVVPYFLMSEIRELSQIVRTRVTGIVGYTVARLALDLRQRE